MADDGLFVGWGQTVRGRESKAVEVFNEAVQYYGQLQADGRIEGFDIWFLAPHGGDLAGFAMLRGERAKLDELQTDPDFERLLVRAGMIIENNGAVRAYTGESLGRIMGHFQEATSDLGD